MSPTLDDVRRLIAAKRRQRPEAASFEAAAASLAADSGLPAPAPWGPLDGIKKGTRS